MIVVVVPINENQNTTEASPQEKTPTEKEEQDIQGKTVIQNASSLQDENSLEMDNDYTDI